MQKQQTAAGKVSVDDPREGSAVITWDNTLFLAISLLTLFARFRSHALLLGSYQDDFFYYLKVAQNIAATGVSTFNGVALTNGYHPLWMVTLVVLCRLFHGTAFFVALQVVSLASAAITYGIALGISRSYVADAPARCVAFLVGMEALLLVRYGMEVTLALPLAMLLIYLLLRRGVPGNAAQAALLGLVASLLILSRLDAGLLVALLCIALVIPPFRTLRSPGVLLGFFCGICPLLCLYFFINLHFFHLLTPVSGLAKQMKIGFSFSAETWNSLRPTNRMRTLLLLPELALILGGVIVAAARQPRPVKAVLPTRVLWSLLLFPLLHLCTLSLLSDWPVWPWYFYSLTLAAMAGCILLSGSVPVWPTVACGCTYAALLVAYAAAYAWRGPDSVTVFQSSAQVAAYMDTHPGVYMMGDQAGTTAYLSHQPIVQTEGLVMDRHFLQLMRAATALPQVAAEYHARYYAKIGGTYDGACLHLSEPANAGSQSPKMLGTICHVPLAIFYRSADGMPIRIFDAGWIR